METVLLYGLTKRSLKAALDKAVRKSKVAPSEIVYVDNQTTDGAWDLANDYADAHPGLVTLARTHRKFGARALKDLAVHLSDESHSRIRTEQDAEKIERVPKIGDTPLVSITVHNFNYGRYLEECLESIFSQSYTNIEVLFSDNASSDESWAIARRFVKKCPTRFFAARNRRNMGPFKNLVNCYKPMRGRLRIEMCSDDFLLPGCIEECVAAFRANEDIGFVMFHRSIIDEHGNVEEEAPFYNRSVKIPGLEQAAVYMMAAVNPSISQVCYDNLKYPKSSDESALGRWWGSRISDFKICLSHPIAYLHKPYLGHRVHGASDSVATKRELLEIIGPYILNLYFADLAGPTSIVAARLPGSKTKLASLSIRYAALALLNSDTVICDQYSHLGQAMDPAVRSTSDFALIADFLGGRLSLEEAQTRIRQSQGLATRIVSYDPPVSSKRLRLRRF